MKNEKAIKKEIQEQTAKLVTILGIEFKKKRSALLIKKRKAAKAEIKKG